VVDIIFVRSSLRTNLLGSTVPVEPQEKTSTLPPASGVIPTCVGFASVIVFPTAVAVRVRTGTLVAFTTPWNTNITLSFVEVPFIPVIEDPGSPDCRILYDTFCLTVVSEAAEISVQFVGVTSVGNPVVLVALSINTAKSPTCAPDGTVMVEAVETELATNPQVAKTSVAFVPVVPNVVR